MLKSIQPVELEDVVLGQYVKDPKATGIIEKKLFQLYSQFLNDIEYLFAWKHCHIRILRASWRLETNGERSRQERGSIPAYTIYLLHLMNLLKLV